MYYRLFLIFIVVATAGRAQMSGVYTINQNTSASRNFQSFGDAITAMDTQSIGGPVQFDVVKGSGPYSEQILITSIPGMSDVNTITFNGAGETVYSTPNSNDRYMVRLDSAKYVTFDSLVFFDSSSTFGFGIHLIHEADHNTISNCVFDFTLLSNGVSGITGAIVASSSYTNGLGKGNNANYCNIINNKIIGGSTGLYDGIRFNGNSGSSDCVGHKIVGNVIEDCQFRHITLDGTENTLVNGNEISRKNKTDGSSFIGIYLGSGSKNNVVSDNQIHSSHNSVNNKASYAIGIYLLNTDASSSNPNRLFNNLIYNLNNSGNCEGIEIDNSDGVEVYHNTIALHDNRVSTGTIVGILQSDPVNNVRVKNNIISITKPGSGNIYGLSYANYNVSDRNNIYLNSSGTGSQYIGKYGTVNYTTLAQWQLALSGAFDQNSKDDNPDFVSATDFHPRSRHINDIGEPLSNVSKDLDGRKRSSISPDAGVYEFSHLDYDAGIVSFIEPFPSCPGQTPIEIKVENNGLKSIDSLRIGWTVNGDTQTTFAWNGLIRPSEDTTIPVGNVFTVLDSAYKIKVWTSYPNDNIDSNSLNDTIGYDAIETAMSGYFTVGVSGNYPSLDSIVSDINRRDICGPIIVDVDSAVYNSQISVGPLKGSSSFNTIIFKGNNATISYSPPINRNYIFQLDSASYVTIDSFIIKCTNQNNGFGIHLTNHSDHATVSNCLFDFRQQTNNLSLSSKVAGISLSSKEYTSYPPSQGMAHNSNHTTIRENTFLGSSISGFSTGVYMAGKIDGTGCEGNKIVNNEFINLSTTAIDARYTNNLLVEDNDISNPSKQLPSGIGIVLNYAKRALISKNVIHNTHDSSSTQFSNFSAIFFGYSITDIGQENRIQNNLVYGIRANRFVTGIDLFLSNGVKVYHNTISLGDGGAQTISGLNLWSPYASSPNTVIENNIFSVIGGGAGNKSGMDINDESVLLSSNFNNIFIDSSGSGLNGEIFYKGQYISLYEWQQINSGMYDQNSDSLDPRYKNTTLNDYTPQSVTINNAGTPISTVVDDIFNNLRNSASPDMGAIEFNVRHSNDDCDSALIISAGRYAGSTVESIDESLTYCGTSIDSSGGVWYKYYPQQSFSFASLCDSKFDTKISVFQGECLALNCLTGNNDTCGVQSQAAWCNDDSVYYILIHGNGNEKGKFTLEIDETAGVNPKISASDSVICLGDSTILTSSPGSNYMWNDTAGSATQSILVWDSSTYVVEVVDSNGCVDSSNAFSVVINDLPQPYIGEDLTICERDSAILKGGIWPSYLWSTGDTTENIVFKGKSGLNLITLSVLDTNGCYGIDTISINVEICTGVKEHGNSASIILYPNPNKGRFTIDANFENNEKLDVKVFDIYGRLLYSKSLLFTGSPITMEMEALSPGNYTLLINGVKTSAVQKFTLK